MKLTFNAEIAEQFVRRNHRVAIPRLLQRRFDLGSLPRRIAALWCAACFVELIIKGSCVPHAVIMSLPMA